MKKIFAFLVLAAFLPALVSAQEIDPYYDDEYWDDWVWEDEGFVVTEAAPPRRLRDDGPVAVAVITAEEIQNSTAVTLVDVLSDHGMVLGDTGHHAGEHSGERIVMQGVDGGNVTILINGRRVAGRQGENVIAATLPLSNVERIEVIRGPQSVRYGTAVGGVINIITKEPEDRVTVSASFTNRFLLPHDSDTELDTQARFDPAREQNFTAVVGFPIGRSRNSIDVEGSRGSFHFDETGVTSLLPRYTRGRAGFSSFLPLTDDVELNYGVSFMMLRSEHQTAVARGTGADPDPNWGRPNFISRRDYVRFDAHIGVDWFVSDEVDLSFGLSNSYWYREFDRFLYVGGANAGGLVVDPGQWLNTPVSGNENITILDVSGSWLFHPALRFTGGVEGGWTVVNSERFPGDTLLWQNYELFIEAEHFVAGRYSVALGVRAMHNPRFDPMAVPRISGALHLGRGFRLLGGVGMGYRVPTFVNLYSELTIPALPNVGYGGPALGNPDLRPETSVGANLGLEWTGTRAFIHVNTFHTELWDQIDAPSIENHASLPWHIPGAGARWRTWRNLDRTFRTGVDAETRVNLPLHTFVSLGYSWVFGWDRDAGEEITLSPPHAIRGRVGIDLPSPNLTANVNFRWASSFSSRGGSPPYALHPVRIDPNLPANTPNNYTGKYYARPSPMQDFESVFTMGFFVGYRLNENWRVHFAGDNLFAGTNAHGNVTAAQTPTFSIGVGFTN